MRYKKTPAGHRPPRLSSADQSKDDTTDRSNRDQESARRTLAEPLKITEFWKNRRRHDTVRVSLQTFEGHVLLDIRQFFVNPEGKMRPTGKGVAINVRLLSQLAIALAKAETTAREMGLIAGEATT